MEPDRTDELSRPGLLAWADQQIEQTKAALRDDPGRAYGTGFTRAAELVREHDPVLFRSLRRLLKDKQVRLGEFDRLVAQRHYERLRASRQSQRAALQTVRILKSPPRVRRVAGHKIEFDRYLASAQGLFALEKVRGAPLKLQLANFSARIVAEIIRDDGLEYVREFEIEAHLNGQVRRILVPAAQFGALRWVTEQLGARAVIAAGRSPRVREAIQLLSAPRLVERTVYTHTGWRKLNDEWVYLHGGGAIGRHGVDMGLAASLPAPLAPFVLPPPPVGKALKNALRASLALSELAPDQVTVPALGAVWRSILGPVDFSLFIYGATGRFKSSLAALLQQHFGAGFVAQRLPGAWASTANFNQQLAFIAKDALLVVDDFRPATGAARQQLHQEADRLLRAAANGAGRGRLNSDGSLLPVHAPRALIVSTGEAQPVGGSLLARLLLIEVDAGVIDRERLSACQRDAAAGLDAQATAGFIAWLASRLDQVCAALGATYPEYRQRFAQAGLHHRTSGIVADLMISWEQFLAFARERGALSRNEAAARHSRVWQALGAVVRGQSAHRRLTSRAHT